jgi:2-dehydropantoate 2-reductase
MHVTVLGAGVLGRIYGVRLAAGGDQVAFLVRPQRAAETSPFVLEQVNGPRRRDALERPERVTEVPRATRAVLLAVRFDQLAGHEGGDPHTPGPAGAGSPLLGLLRQAPAVPLIVITPMLPGPRALVEKALGRRLTAAMPGAAGYLDERGVVRYWLTSVAPTLVEGDPAHPRGGPDGPAIEELLLHLGKAGLPAHRERNVGALNAATTTAFFPLVAAIDAGGGIEGILADKDLFATVIDAARESDALGQKLGKVASWAHLLTRFVGPYTLKPAVALAHRLLPEAIRFAEEHFGHKLHDQHLAMGGTILELGREVGLPMPALERLMEVLRARTPGR